MTNLETTYLAKQYHSTLNTARYYDSFDSETASEWYDKASIMFDLYMIARHSGFNPLVLE